MSTPEALDKLKDASLSQIIARFAAHPELVGTVTFDGIEAGAGSRKHLRSAFDRARVRGAEVDVREQRGWLESVFVIRLRGTAGQLLPTLRLLRDLGED